jgi:hypothetical protein
MGRLCFECGPTFRVVVQGKDSSFIPQVIPTTRKSSGTLVPFLPGRLFSCAPGQRRSSFHLLKTKTIVYSAVILIGAIWSYRFLYTGGWLTNPYYRLNDPDIVNLLVAIFEPIAVSAVISYWIWRTRTLYRLVFISFLTQLIVGAGYLTMFLLFVLTYKPRMM